MGEMRRLTMGQALVRFLAEQYSERDGARQPFFAGVFGIFGHGNVAGVGQALHQDALAGRGLRYYQTRNEQAMVHTAAAFAKMHNRLRACACTTSIGPGATNMVTGAATATINRLPVLLLPGDIFATRRTAPVLQQLESPQTQDVSVNDCFRPVSRYWDRLNRPEQLIYALPEALRVLTSPAEPGANIVAREADVVIAVGTRLSDFTTASKTAFQHPDARFVAINVAEFDAHKQGALPLVGDARVTLNELRERLAGYDTGAEYRARA